MKLAHLAFATGLLGLNVAHAATIAPDTQIAIRTMGTIRAVDANENRTFPATIDRDVFDHDGHLAIPRGADAELIVRRAPGNELILDLRAVRVGGRRYILDTDDYVQEGGERRHRNTGAYAGGGALIGGIIGAIAGGGRGAAVGALSGGALGAGTALATRGREVRVPAESLLTFRLERPVRITEFSDHYDRDRARPDRDQYDRH